MQQHSFQIQFHFQAPATLRNRKALKTFLVDQLHGAGRNGGVLNVVFCSDETLLQINREHLNHDYYTDIITFELSDKDADYLVADIYISVDRVRDNARHWGVQVAPELHRVIFHGILHLLGFKDKKKPDQIRMRDMEDQWLETYFQ